VPDGGGTTSVPARGSAYRGAIQAVAGPNGLGLVNQLDVERYLAGMAEVPASWPPAVQQAQAIAARTYALRAMASGGELCDTQRCQVYVGAGGENANLRAAVEATRGQVLTHGGGLIEAVYSADAGGVSATPLEGFGTSDGAFPYLTTVAYDTPDPLPWVADIALRDVAARTAYPGTLTGVALGATGPSGRALEVVLDGDAGPRTVGGLAFAAALGLRSTLFTATILNGAAPPPPAGVDAFTQALPGAPAGPAGPGAAGLPTDPATVAAAGATGTGAAGRAVTLVAVAALLATVGLGVVTGRGSVVDPVLARPAPLTPEAIERRRRDASTVRRRAPRPAT
jgi:stage II sporulation protein D